MVVGPALTRVGCDVQAVEPVARALEDFGQRYLDRVFSTREQRGLEGASADSLAARFAGKEAVLKLVGRAEGVDLRCVEILGGTGARPWVHLAGPLADAAQEAGLGAIDLSFRTTAEWPSPWPWPRAALQARPGRPIGTTTTGESTWWRTDERA